MFIWELERFIRPKPHLLILWCSQRDNIASFSEYSKTKLCWQDIENILNNPCLHSCNFKFTFNLALFQGYLHKTVSPYALGSAAPVPFLNSDEVGHSIRIRTVVITDIYHKVGLWATYLYFPTTKLLLGAEFENASISIWPLKYKLKMCVLID